MPTNEIKVGPQTVADGAQSVARGGRSGETSVADAHARYQEAVLRGGVYRLAAPNAAPSAFIGGAGGTPLLSIYNPAGSGKNLVVLGIGLSSRILGSAILNTSFNLWAGVSVANTGSQTQATNALTNVASGSVAYATVNTATTSSTAITLALPVASYFWGTSVGQYMSGTFFDIGGLVVAPPGVLVAFGASIAVATATFDSSIVWEEVAV